MSGGIRTRWATVGLAFRARRSSLPHFHFRQTHGRLSHLLFRFIARRWTDLGAIHLSVIGGGLGALDAVPSPVRRRCPIGSRRQATSATTSRRAITSNVLPSGAV